MLLYRTGILLRKSIERYLIASTIKSQLPTDAERSFTTFIGAGAGPDSRTVTIFAPNLASCAGKARATGPLPAKIILEPGKTL